MDSHNNDRGNNYNAMDPKGFDDEFAGPLDPRPFHPDHVAGRDHGTYADSIHGSVVGGGGGVSSGVYPNSNRSSTDNHGSSFPSTMSQYEAVLATIGGYSTQPQQEQQQQQQQGAGTQYQQLYQQTLGQQQQPLHDQFMQHIFPIHASAGSHGTSHNTQYPNDNLITNHQQYQQLLMGNPELMRMVMKEMHSSNDNNGRNLNVAVAANHAASSKSPPPPPPTLGNDDIAFVSYSGVGGAGSSSSLTGSDFIGATSRAGVAAAGNPSRDWGAVATAGGGNVNSLSSITDSFGTISNHPSTASRSSSRNEDITTTSTSSGGHGSTANNIVSSYGTAGSTSLALSTTTSQIANPIPLIASSSTAMMDIPNVVHHQHQGHHHQQQQQRKRKHKDDGSGSESRPSSSRGGRGGGGGRKDSPSVSRHSMKWQQRYNELLQYKAIHNHCNVPNEYPANPQLGRWVKRQRHQYWIKQQHEQRQQQQLSSFGGSSRSSRSSSMTLERQLLLDNIGFVWGSHHDAWEKHFHYLQVFQMKHGHCKVPSSYPDNPQLAIWAKRQRREFKLFSDEVQQQEAQGDQQQQQAQHQERSSPFSDDDTTTADNSAGNNSSSTNNNANNTHTNATRFMRLATIGFVFDNRDNGGGGGTGGDDATTTTGSSSNENPTPPPPSRSPMEILSMYFTRLKSQQQQQQQQEQQNYSL